MPEPSDFASLEELCDEARAHFRSHEGDVAKEVDQVLELLLDVFRSVGQLYTVDELRGSKQEAAMGVLVQALETVLAMYFLSQDGFWDNALVLKRNYAELLLVALGIGHDHLIFVDWKHGRGNVSSFEKVLRRVDASTDVPCKQKSVLPLLKRYWCESSQSFSHSFSRSSIRTSVVDGQVHFEPKTATAEFQHGRMRALRNMLLNLAAALLSIVGFQTRAYEKRESFPDGASVAARARECFQNEKWKAEQTN